MKFILSILRSAASIAAVLALAACVSNPPPPTVETTVTETPTGAEIVETIQVTATVAGMNYDTRQVVLLGPDGRNYTYKVDKSAINFDQIRIGDQVKATVTEKLAVFLNKDKAPASAGVATTVALAPKGAMPGGVVAETAEVTATVKTVYVNTRKVTLQFVDGTTDTVKVGKGVDLAKVRPGDSVTARVSESIAIAVEKS